MQLDPVIIKPQSVMSCRDTMWLYHSVKICHTSDLSEPFAAIRQCQDEGLLVIQRPHAQSPLPCQSSANPLINHLSPRLIFYLFMWVFFAVIGLDCLCLGVLHWVLQRENCHIHHGDVFSSCGLRRKAACLGVSTGVICYMWLLQYTTEWQEHKMSLGNGLPLTQCCQPVV